MGDCKVSCLKLWGAAVLEVEYLEIDYRVLRFPEATSSPNRLINFFKFFVTPLLLWMNFGSGPPKYVIQRSEFSLVLFFKCLFLGMCERCTSVNTAVFKCCVFWKLPQVTFVLRNSLALPRWFWKLSAFSCNFKSPEKPINPSYKGKEDWK